MVVHTNGIHNVAVSFCDCRNVGVAGSHRQQLLRRRWYPATHLEPQSCFTFQVLEQFHLLTLQGKLSSYDYYGALEKLTDNVGLSLAKVGLYGFLLEHHLTCFRLGSIFCLSTGDEGMAVSEDAEAGWSWP